MDINGLNFGFMQMKRHWIFFFIDKSKAMQTYYTVWRGWKKRNCPRFSPSPKFNRSSKHILRFFCSVIRFASSVFTFSSIDLKVFAVQSLYTTVWYGTLLSNRMQQIFLGMLCFNVKSNAIDSSNEEFLRDDDITNCLIRSFGVLSHFFSVVICYSNLKQNYSFSSSLGNKANNSQTATASSRKEKKRR